MPILDVLKKLAEKEDYGAIVEVAAECADREIKGDRAGGEDRAEFQRFIEGLVAHEQGQPIPEKNAAIVTGIMNALQTKNAQVVVECEKDIRSNMQKMDNGEFPELSILMRKPENKRKVAQTLTFAQTGAGLKLGAYAQVFSDFGFIQENGEVSILDNTDAVRYSMVKNALLAEYPDMEESLNNQEFLNDFCKGNVGNVDDYSIARQPVNVGDPLIISINKDHAPIKQIRDDALADALKQKEKEYEIYKTKDLVKVAADTEKMKLFADDAKKLMDDLGKIHGIDNENPAIISLKNEIVNAAKYGTPEHLTLYTHSIYAKYAARGKTAEVNITTFKDAITILRQAAENLRNTYQGKEGDEAAAAIEAANKTMAFVEKKQQFYDSIKDEHNRIIKSNIENDIKFIKIEMAARSKSSVNIQKLAMDSRLRDQKINVVGRYASDAQRGLMILGQAAQWMTGDKQNHKNPSPSYTSFSNAMEDLGKMNAETTKPEDLLSKMREAYNAAVVYEEKHTGMLHPLSAYKPNGKARLHYAQLAKDYLAMKIAELAPEVANVKTLIDDSTPAAFTTALKDQNTAARSEISQERSNIALAAAQAKAENQPEENYVEKQIREAQEALKAANGQAAPDKAQYAEQYAVITAGLLLKNAQKDALKNISPKSFNSYKNMIAGGKAFKELMDRSTSESLYDQAVNNNGLKLYDSFAKSFKALKAAEDAKRPSEPAENKSFKNEGPAK